MMKMQEGFIEGSGVSPITLLEKVRLEVGLE